MPCYRLIVDAGLVKCVLCFCLKLGMNIHTPTTYCYDLREIHVCQSRVLTNELCLCIWCHKITQLNPNKAALKEGTQHMMTINAGTVYAS